VNERQIKIKEICSERNIRWLVHFTQVNNLCSILREGLLSRKKLESWPSSKRPHFSDRFRDDSYTGANCLSITSPNYPMFRKYQIKYPDIIWAVLAIEPRVLWELNCAFCARNASSIMMRNVPIDKLMLPDSLEGLFHGVQGNLPCNCQAEVLVFNTLSPQYIKWIYFKNDKEHRTWKENCTYKNVPCSVDASLFNFRR